MSGTLYVCVHRGVEKMPSPKPPIGWVIDGATRLRWGGPGGAPPPDGWTFPDGPATHAFVIMRGEDGCLYRVDAHAPKVTCRCIDMVPGTEPQPRHFDCPTAVWEVLASPVFGVDPAAGAVEAWKHAQSGSEYDFVQCALQALAMVLPSTVPVPFQGAANRIICTEEACRVLRACGGHAKFLADDVMDRDHYPEELARKLVMSEGPWARRTC